MLSKVISKSLQIRLFSSQQSRGDANASKRVSIDPKSIQQSIKNLNDQQKSIHESKRGSKVYIERMSEDRIAKIGSQTLLDKQWADKPIAVIRNPHKLTEVELYKTLEKIVDLPEKRLRSMLTLGNNAVDEVFLANVIQRIPQFLTATLVNITKTLMLQKDYFKDHIIWRALEKELFKRRNNLNNEQLAAVVYSFGVTGNGSKEFYYDLEETIVDSPIPIETEHLEKILAGYSQIDQGSPVFYSSIVEKLIGRGIENMPVEKIVEICKNLKRATNTQQGGFGFFEVAEKHIHNELHHGRIGFAELCAVAENIFANNIGSNEFQLEIENFLLKLYSSDNLQHITDLLKGLSTYTVKNPELENRLYQTLHLHMDDFTIKQLETLIWSMSRFVKAQIKQLEEPHKLVLQELVDRVKTKAPSMKPRGVAFAIDSIANLDTGASQQETFQRLEKVVISKLDDFIPHYLVKVLSAYYRAGFGSGELYDKLIHNIIQSLTTEGSGLKYSDMLRFFEIFREVSYIFDNTMSEDLYKVFVGKIERVMKDKKFPTEDICRVFNILVNLGAYMPTKESDHMMHFIAELLGRLRHSIYDIPKDYFTQTLVNLLEFQQPELASKFVFIIQEVAKQGKLEQEFAADRDKIRLYWSLMQIEKGCLDSNIVNSENLAFLAEVNLNNLDAKHFLLYKQLVCLAKMWFDQHQPAEGHVKLDFDKIYDRFNKDINQDKREDFINADPVTKCSQGTVAEIVRIVKKTKHFMEISENLSDDLMNCVNVACAQKGSTQQAPRFFGILLMNKHCYLHSPFHENGTDPIVRRTVELKQDILEQMFGWSLLIVDEQDYMAMGKEDREQWLLQKMGIAAPKELETANKETSQPPGFGRKVKGVLARKPSKYT